MSEIPEDHVCDPTLPDCAAFLYYEDPAHLVVAPTPGVGRPRRPARLTSHVPVRFRSEVIASVRAWAAKDGVSVSTWIRQAVDRELQRRQPTKTVTVGNPAATWTPTE